MILMSSISQEKELRDHEIEDFWICVNEAKTENTRRAAAIVDEFKAYRTKILVRQVGEHTDLIGILVAERRSGSTRNPIGYCGRI